MASVLGSLDGTGIPWVRFQLVSPATQKPTSLTGIIDTGFSGFLVLPRALNEELKLPQTLVFAHYELASGSLVDMGHVRAKVLFGGKSVKSDLIALSPSASAILIGTLFLQQLGFGLFIRGGQVIVVDENESIDDLKKVVAGWTSRKRR